MRRAIVAALLSSFPLPASSQLQQPLWRLHTDRSIVFYRPTPEGILVVSTEGALLGVDRATGRVLWTRGDVPNSARPDSVGRPATSFGVATAVPAPRAWLDPLWAGSYGVLTIDSAGKRAWIELIDLQTGARRWDSRDLPVGDVRGHFEIPGGHLLLVYGAAGEPGSPKRVWLGVDLETGALRWQTDSLLAEPAVEFETDGTGLEASRGTLRGHQWPVLDTDSTAVLFVSEEGPVRINLRTGTRVWASGVKTEKLPALAHDYPPVLYAGSVLYVPFGKSLQAFNDSNGRPLWAEPRKFPGQVAQLELTAAGLLVRGAKNWQPPPGESWGARGPERGGRRFLDLLNPATGESVWPKRSNALDVMMPFVLDGDRVFAATNEKLYVIALATGEPSELAAFKLQGGERPQVLERMNGGLLLIQSPHNLLLFDTAGVLRYHTYFAPPGPSALARLGVLAANIGGMYSWLAGGGYYPWLVLARQERLRRRVADYAYIVAAHADSAGNPGLLKVSKDTGQPVSRLLLGTKWPTYKLDESAGVLFFQKDEREIDCYRF